MGYPVAKIPAAKIRQFLEELEPEVIIECPACQTKFRIEASKLSAEAPAANRLGKSKARFHCSRCDYVFSAEVATSGVMSHSEKTIKSVVENDSSQFSESTQTEYTQTEYTQTGPAQTAAAEHIPVPAPEESAPQYNVDFEDLNYNPPAPDMPIEIEFEKPSDSSATTPSEQQQLAFNFSSSPAAISPEAEEVIQSPVTMADPIIIENASQAQESAEHHAFSPNSENTQSSWLDQNSSQSDFSDFKVEPVVAHEISEVEATRVVDDIPASLAQFNYNPQSQTTSSTAQIPEDYSRYALDFSQKDEEAASDFSKQEISAGPISSNLFSPPSSASQSPNSSGSYRAKGIYKKYNSNLTSLAVLTLPLLIGLSLLGATTLYLGKNLNASEKLLTSIFPKAQRETPSGVFVQQPKLESMVLDSGDIVNVVTGTIVNQSKKILTSLTIEGLGFSDSGKIITSEKVLVGNPISTNNATLKTLTPSNIKELQSKEPKSFILRPDAKTKFTLVFTKPVKATTTQSLNSDTDGNMSSFAVRVYSARFRSE